MSRIVVAVAGALVLIAAAWGVGEVRGRGVLSLLSAGRAGKRAPTALAGQPLALPMARPARAALQIGRIEARRLVLHPAFLALGSFWLLAFMPFYLQGSSDGYWLLGTGAVLFGMGALIATNLCALRSRLDRSEDLFAALPVPAPARTIPFALASIAAALAASALLTVLALRPGLEFRQGEAGFRSVFDVAQLPLFVGLSGVLGVFLARWLPSRLAAPAIAAVLWMLVGPIENAKGGGRWFFPITGAPAPIAALRWHLVYVAGLIVVLSALAVLRVGWRWVMAVGVALGVAVAAAGGSLQLGAA